MTKVVTGVVSAAIVATIGVVLLRENGEPVDGPGLIEESADHATGFAIDAEWAAFSSRPIGGAVVGLPWVTDLATVDLDGDGLLDVVVCDAKANSVSWIRQTGPGAYVERAIGEEVAGPAHVEFADMDGDGDLDALVASMGIVTPSNEKLGAVIVLENLGRGDFARRTLLENVARVTYVGAGDLDGDGDLDLSVAQFGYFEGETRWMENLGDWKFESHALLDKAGAIHAPVADLEGDGDLDIVVLVSQDSEEVWALMNDGRGGFTPRVLYGSLNKDFGSSGLTVADLDEDGDVDIVFTNGDAFDYATPGSRPWHGAQWLENLGDAGFRYRRLGDFSGAYSPLVIDLDGDGDRDVVVASGFNDWSDPAAFSLACFVNDGSEKFVLRPLASTPTHLVVVDGGDFDGDGRVELVTGGFHFYPPYEAVSRVRLWDAE